MFDASVMRDSLWSKTDAEDVSIIGTVADKEGSVRFIGQFRFGFFPTQRTPVPATLTEKIWNITIINTLQSISNLRGIAPFIVSLI